MEAVMADMRWMDMAVGQTDRSLFHRFAISACLCCLSLCPLPLSLNPPLCLFISLPLSPTCTHGLIDPVQECLRRGMTLEGHGVRLGAGSPVRRPTVCCCCSEPSPAVPRSATLPSEHVQETAAYTPGVGCVCVFVCNTESQPYEHACTQITHIKLLYRLCTITFCLHQITSYIYKYLILVFSKYIGL